MEQFLRISVLVAAMGFSGHRGKSRHPYWGQKGPEVKGHRIVQALNLPRNLSF